MLDVSEMLEYDEYLIERYRVQLTEFVNSGWALNGPWMRAAITNRRLILLPEVSDYNCDPTTIPLTEIRKIWNVGLGRKDGVMLALKSGERLHMFVDWNQGQKLMRATREMMSVRPVFHPKYLL